MIHQLSKGYDGYSPDETDKKIKDAREFGKPLTCDYIREQGFDCPNGCNVKAPAGLAYRNMQPIHALPLIEPISSEPNYERLRAFLDRTTQGIKTGYEQLDRVTGGLDGIVVLAGQPASGKSTFALNMAMHAAGQWYPGLVLRLSRMRNAKRWQNCSALPRNRLTNPCLVIFSLKYLKSQPTAYLATGNLIYIFDDKRISFDTAEHIVESIKDKHNTDQLLIVLDSLQKAPNIGGNGDRRNAIDVLLRGMEALKKSQGVTILAISEYSRGTNGYPAIPSLNFLERIG